MFPGSVTGGSTTALYVRYAKEITLHITLQDDTKDGKIKIPYFSIKYADVSREAAEGGASVQVGPTITFCCFNEKRQECVFCCCHFHSCVCRLQLKLEPYHERPALLQVVEKQMTPRYGGVL